MNLQCIFTVEGNEELEAEYQAIYGKLKEEYQIEQVVGIARFDGFDYDRIFKTKRISHGYAQNTHSGTLNEGIELTELELSMIVDNGYSYFGGSSIIGEGGLFKVIIYTD